MEMNKKIFLEYFFLPLFGVCPLFESVSGRELNESEGTLISFFSLIILNFHSP